MRLLAMGGLCAVALAAPVACGGPASSACEQVTEKREAVIDAYCAGKDDTCWYCKCLNRDEQVKVTRVGDEVVFSCIPASQAPETSCEGTALEQAQACLANEQSCIDDDATLEATSKCGATKP